MSQSQSKSLQTKPAWQNRILPFLHWLPLLNRNTIKDDIIAGITAGILVLPQAIALASLAGLPPEYGIYTSLFPVIIAALFGSSFHTLSGPNTAICILIAFTLAPYASVASNEWIQYAITLGFMAGLIQLGFGMARLAIVFSYFSQTVMIALITGVGIIIILSQLGNLIGVLMNIAEPSENRFLQIIYALDRINGFALVAGLATVLSGWIIKILRPKWPYLIIALIVGMSVATLEEGLFSATTTGLDKLGMMSLSALPLSQPDFSPETFSETSQGLIPAAIIIAFLGLMQASLIARAIASQSGQHIDLNQEAIGQGLANIIGSFLSCFPSCSSFNRSTSNYQSGAKTPFAAIISVLVLAGLVTFATPLIAHLPIAVMAGILMLVGAGLIKQSDLIRVLKESHESRFIFLLTLATTVYGGIDNGVFIGIFLSIVAYLRSVSKPEIKLIKIADDSATDTLASIQHIIKTRSPQPPPEPSQYHKSATILQISGNLFFGSIHQLEQALMHLAQRDNRMHDLIIVGEDLQYLDSAGAAVIAREVKLRAQKGAQVSLRLKHLTMNHVIASSGLTHLLGENIHYVNLSNEKPPTQREEPPESVI